MSNFIRPLRVGTHGEGEPNIAGAQSAWGDVSILSVGTLAYTDTAAKTLFKLAHPYRIIEAYADVTTAFNDSGTDQLSIGFSGTQGAFMNAADVSSIGRKLGSATATLTNFINNNDDGLITTVTAIYAGQNSNATTGAANISILYTLPRFTNP